MRQFKLELFDDEVIVLDTRFKGECSCFMLTLSPFNIGLKPRRQSRLDGGINIQFFQQGQGFHGQGLYRIRPPISMI